MAERTVALVGDVLEAGAPPAATAVLARVNSALLPVQVALTEAGVPNTAPLDASVLGRTGVRTALSYLRLGLDLQHIRRDDLLDTINRPARKVKSAVAPLLRRSGRYTIRQLGQLADGLDTTHRDRFDSYLDDLRHLAGSIADGADTARSLWIVRNRIGLGEAMDALDASRTRPEGSSHGDDLDALDQFAALHPDPASFRDWLVDRLRVPSDPQGVTLSTVHRVKGMEWDHVVVFAANQGLFPHRLADDIEEERRVFHVAVTRCRDTVAIVADRERTSRFVGELATASDRTSRPGHPPDSNAALQAAVAPVELPDGAVATHPGLEIALAGGFAGRVIEVRDGAAVARIHLPGSGPEAQHSQVARIPFGEAVRVEGRRTRLAPPVARTTDSRARMGAPVVGTAGSGTADTAATGGRRPTSGGGGNDPETLDRAGEALFEALRAWRLQVAGDNHVPPYLVFHDRHLRGIAARRPRSLRDLAGCPGVGPTKLERYGDDVLDLVDQHL